MSLGKEDFAGRVDFHSQEPLILEEVEAIFVEGNNENVVNKIDELLDSGFGSPKFIGKLLAFVEDWDDLETIIENYATRYQNLDAKDVILGYQEILDDEKFNDINLKRYNHYFILSECAGHESFKLESLIDAIKEDKVFDELGSAEITDILKELARRKDVSPELIINTVKEDRIFNELGSAEITDILKELARRKDVSPELIINTVKEDRIFNELGSAEITDILKELARRKDVSPDLIIDTIKEDKIFDKFKGFDVEFILDVLDEREDVTPEFIEQSKKSIKEYRLSRLGYEPSLQLSQSSASSFSVQGLGRS